MKTSLIWGGVLKVYIRIKIEFNSDVSKCNNLISNEDIIRIKWILYKLIVLDFIIISCLKCFLI